MLLVVACGSATPKGSASESPGPGTTADPGTSVGSTAGTGGSQGPAQSGPAASGSGSVLPAPTLGDPAQIGAALWDPARMEQGVVSLVDQLGVPIYAADGSLARPSSRPGPSGMWLDESEVRWLIEMGRADARAMAAGSVPFTLGDLTAALAPLMPSMTEQQIVDAYAAAYRAAPGDLVAASLAGRTLRRDTALTRVHLWLLLLDGLVRRAPAASAARGVTLASWPRTASAPVASVNLPPISSPVADLAALDFAFLVTQAPLLGSRIQVDYSILPGLAHEGHGQAGPTVVLEARNHGVPTPLVSPFLGTVLLIPRTTGLGGVPISFESADQATLDAHGFFDGVFGLPIPTDAQGVTRASYEVNEEEGGGQGTVQSAAAGIDAVIDLRTALAGQYIVAPEVVPFIWGTRVLPGTLQLEWHAASTAGEYDITLTGRRAGAGHYKGTAKIYCTETPNGAGSIWTIVAQPLADITDFSLGNNVSGWDSVSVETKAQAEFDPWFAQSNSPGDTATVTVTRSGATAEFHGTGSHTYGDGTSYTVEIRGTCIPSE